MQQKSAEPRYEGGPSEINFIEVLRWMRVAYTAAWRCPRTAFCFCRVCCMDIDVPRATYRISQRLHLMPQVKASIQDVYRHLLERSGLLREPVEAGSTSCTERSRSTWPRWTP